VCNWADYLALEARRVSLPGLGRRLVPKAGQEAQILIRTALPCGALAECGVCAVPSPRGPLLACKDGPVFKLADLLWGGR
jgi:hypothetical protein